MKHYGDITKINGAELPVVDIITGGSPCQDLSVAGKRAGLAGERSGLFKEQIRIIKEMRDHDRANRRADEHIRPRYMVWENVPGAFSSNKGEDFSAVLEETAKVAERDACIPRFESGKWPNAGCIMGNGWSIAWRVHDAQFWGVPQRRKRIALVADFGGQTAPEILFERKGVSGDFEESGTPGETATGDAAKSIGETGKLDEWCAAVNSGARHQQDLIQHDQGIARTLAPGTHASGSHLTKTLVTSSINTRDNQQAVVYGISAYDSNAMKSSNPNSGIYEAETARTLDLNGGSPACNQGGMAVVSMATKQLAQNVGDNVAMPICANDYKEPQVVCLEGNGSRPSHQGDGWHEGDPMYTLNSTERHAVYDARGNGNGQIAPTITGDYQNRITDYTAITYQETTGSLYASGYDKLGTQEALNDMYVVQKQHGFAMQAIGEYKDCESASSLKQRDYKDATDLVVAFTPDSIVKNTDEGVAYSMLSGDYKDPQLVAYGLDRASYNQGQNAKFGFSVEEEKIGPETAMGPGAVATYQNVTGTLCERISAGTSNQIASDDMLVANTIVRILTPLECERLQGFPDHWTDIGDWVDSKGKKHKDSDSPRYKALGNSIALPFWTWMAGRMVRNLPGTPTMGSLFDGIGGFPFAFSGWGCEPVWASEIEEFPIAVTKRRFPDA